LTSDTLSSFTVRAAVPMTVVWIVPAGLLAFTLSKDFVAKAEFEIVSLRESAPMDSFLRHPVGLYYFRNHLSMQHAEENVDFYFAAKSFYESYSTKELALPPDALHDIIMRHGGDVTMPMTWADVAAYKIYSEFVDEGASLQINIESDLRRELQEFMRLRPVPRHAFLDAQAEVYKILATDSFPRFRSSKSFASALRDVADGKSLEDIMMGSPARQFRSFSTFGSFLLPSGGSSRSPLNIPRRMSHLLTPSKLSESMKSSKTKSPGASSEDLLAMVGVRDPNMIAGPGTPRGEGESPAPELRRTSTGISLFSRDSSNNSDNGSAVRDGLAARIGNFRVFIPKNDSKEELRTTVQIQHRMSGSYTNLLRPLSESSSPSKAEVASYASEKVKDRRDSVGSKGDS